MDPPTVSSSSGGSEPRTSAATGSAMPAWPSPSTRHRARSASLPGSSEPISSARPRQRAPPMVAICSACRARQRPRTVRRRTRTRTAPGAARRRAGRPPATRPRPRRARPGRRRRAAPGPARCRRRAGRWTTGSGPPRCRWRRPVRSRPGTGAPRGRARRPGRASRAGPGTPPGCSRGSCRQNSSSSMVSARWVCSRTPSDRASAADSRNRSVVTENGEQGASADPHHRAGRRVVVALDRGPGDATRIASSVSTTESGGSPPWDWPRSIEPRVGWKRSPIRRAASTVAPSGSPPSRGNR